MTVKKIVKSGVAELAAKTIPDREEGDIRRGGKGVGMKGILHLNSLLTRVNQAPCCHPRACAFLIIKNNGAGPRIYPF